MIPTDEQDRIIQNIIVNHEAASIEVTDEGQVIIIADGRSYTFVGDDGRVQSWPNPVSADGIIAQADRAAR